MFHFARFKYLLCKPNYLCALIHSVHTVHLCFVNISYLIYTSIQTYM